jgi:hypothetical protein
VVYGEGHCICRKSSRTGLVGHHKVTTGVVGVRALLGGRVAGRVEANQIEEAGPQLLPVGQGTRSGLDLSPVAVRERMNMGTFIGKVLNIRREWIDGRTTVTLVREPVGV